MRRGAFCLASGTLRLGTAPVRASARSKAGLLVASDFKVTPKLGNETMLETRRVKSTAL